MNKGLLLLVICLAVFSLLGSASAGGLSGHDESGKIRSLLRSILKKMDRDLAKEKSSVKEAQQSVSAATSALARAQGKLDSESGEAERHSAVTEAEKRTISKILVMLSHDVGKHKEHAGASCEEVLQDASVKDGNYWVLVKGEAKRVFCARQNGRIVFSGACNKASLGNGWRRQCLNEVDFDKASSYVSVNSNGVIKIKRAGFYRITSKRNSYSEAFRNHFGRIIINGKNQQYGYYKNQYASTDQMKLYWPLKKGNTVYATWYINAGSHSVRAAASDDHDGANRLQIEYFGDFEEVPAFSGGCNGHRRAGSWAKNCAKRRDWTLSSITRKTFSVDASSGDIVAKKSGYYHIQAVNMLHNNNWNYRHCDVKVDGKRIFYGYDARHSWNQLTADVTYWVNAGQRVTIRWHSAGGNPYTRHSMSNNNGYNRLQVVYKGGAELRPFQWEGGCKQHGRAKGWNTYCLNGVRRNDLGKQISVASNGIITVKQSGFYRINCHAIQKRKQNENAYSRILVDGKTMDTNTQWAKKRWTEAQHDIVLPLNKGQKVQVQYMATNYAYHSWGTHSSFSIEFIDNRK